MQNLQENLVVNLYYIHVNFTPFKTHKNLEIHLKFACNLHACNEVHV